MARLNQAQLDGLALDWAHVEDVLPLSPLQQGMLFHSLYAPETGAYINQLQVCIDGLDVARFAASWQAVLARHDSCAASITGRPWRSRCSRSPAR